MAMVVYRESTFCFVLFCSVLFQKLGWISAEEPTVFCCLFLSS